MNKNIHSSRGAGRNLLARVCSVMTMSLETRPLHVPPLEELAKVLEEGLRGTFAEVSVGVVECPDLSLPPWNLATPGLCGSPRLLDVGGVPYLMPVADKNKHYDLGEVAAMAGVPGGLIIGAGAGSSRVAGVNCEMMPNVRAPHGADPGLNNTYIAKVSTEDGSCILERFPSLETGPLANVLLCEGRPGKPDFSVEPLTSDEAVNSWLRFYEVPAPLTCLSEFISHDPGLDLRVEHTHCFSNHGDGGHYHYDTTPSEVHYHAYYTVAEQLVRIDQPPHTHSFGRD